MHSSKRDKLISNNRTVDRHSLPATDRGMPEQLRRRGRLQILHVSGRSKEASSCCQCKLKRETGLIFTGMLSTSRSSTSTFYKIFFPVGRPSLSMMATKLKVDVPIVSFIVAAQLFGALLDVASLLQRQQACSPTRPPAAPPTSSSSPLPHTTAIYLQT